MAARPRRQRVSLENRECLIRAFNGPAQDYLSVADTIGVNRSTARGIVRRHLQEGQIAERPRGGPNHRKVDNEMKQCIEEILNENPVLTLDGINRLLQERLPDKPRIHSRTVGKVLNGMLYTFKLVRRCPAERNRPDVIQSRRDYAAWFLGEAIQRQIVFIDECGFNVWTARSQGRALRGDRAYRQVSGQKGRNISIILAVSSTFGLVHHSMHIGGTNRDRFQVFLDECAQNVAGNETVFIYDGAPAHRGAVSMLKKSRYGCYHHIPLFSTSSRMP
ncbi:Cyclin-dependent kinase-like 2 [Paramuricea clavata]|uniref:Cyclin-dependent kinase-like 2 n=1 Tax=Paramuricea clavata TaxID=317549 RepID=A0A6S7HT48_PARCT|nr:Cyclin-dependent kinase-like 2 [Paramuricea clavata]